ncbi:MAG: metal ABC transporter permease [Deltaproteobacteria bacterium]|nr:metal ABC transporter permease [Deltaproteobacteria bacterium]MBI4373270.1 metal ABC transporter permease [Deltaproteobacteria bacterium]
MNTLWFLLPAFTACLILTAIHTYLGIHVIQRGIIFVDISLAQIAALGMTVAFLIGYHPEEQIAYLFALGFAVLASLFFAFFRDDRVPQEALIGVAFAVSSALSVLIAAVIPHGGEHLKFILSGNILWVSEPQLLKTFLIYALIGGFHYYFKNIFLLVSSQPEVAKQQGHRIELWNFFFYLTFAVVITSSVQIAGVLLVFSFLIVPALCSLLFYESLRGRLLFGWLIGGLTSLLGLTFSYLFDLPTGPTIVAGFGLVLFLCLVTNRLLRRKGSRLSPAG